MKSLFLCAALAFIATFAFTGKAQAGCCDPACCQKMCCKTETVEVCRRCFTKCTVVCGCEKIIQYIEVTYKTTDCCGNSKVWTKVYRV